MLAVETDARWKSTIEGEWGIPMIFPTQNQTNLISSSMHVVIGSNLLSGPYTQTAKNNTLIVPLGATLIQMPPHVASRILYKMWGVGRNVFYQEDIR